MLAVAAVSDVLFKNRLQLAGPMMFVAAGVTTLAAGMGLRIREIAEGPFAYLDSAMWVLCGMLFVMMLVDNGTMDYLFGKITGKKRGSALQLMLLLLFIALPGMLTGTAAACLATTGVTVGRYLLGKGLAREKVIELVAVGSLFGMVLPPLCLPAMAVTIAREGGYPGSFEGYFIPLLAAALPAFAVYCLTGAKRLLDGLETDSGTAKAQSGGFACLIPLIVVALLLFSHNFLYSVMPFLGYPLIYTIGFALAAFLGVRRANPLESAAAGARIAAPSVALMFAFGAVLETFTLVGVSGTVSARLVIDKVSAVPLAVGCILVITAGAAISGSGFSFSAAALSTYLVSALYYGAAEMPMAALGLTLAAGMMLPMRGGLVGRAQQALEVGEVPIKTVLKHAVVPAGLLLAAALVFAATGAGLRFLMI